VPSINYCLDYLRFVSSIEAPSLCLNRYGQVGMGRSLRILALAYVILPVSSVLQNMELLNPMLYFLSRFRDFNIEPRLLRVKMSSWIT